LDQINLEILTQLGYIKGRDAIHVDSFHQKANFIEIIGEINGNLCTNNYNESRWYKFMLSFKNVMVFRREALDIYPWKKWDTKSNFDEVKNSTWITEYELDDKKFKHYIIETYDDVYFVICEEFELKIIGER